MLRFVGIGQQRTVIEEEEIMANFDAAYEVLIHFEGSIFEDRKSDPGGPTKYGITLRFIEGFFKARKMPGHARVEDIRDLTLERARIIYKEMVWDKHKMDKVSAQVPATLLLLAIVHRGPWYATRSAQRALRALGHPVKIDGLLGPLTIAAINGDLTCDYFRLSFSAAFRSEMAGDYRAIIQDAPEREEELEGWINRAMYPY